jgi:hypothetical protein
MTGAKFTRTIAADGSVRLASPHGSFVFARPKPGVLLVTVTGHDNGDYGSATLDEILQFLKRERPLTLFVDTREAISVAPSVRSDWTSFLSSNRDQLRAVHVLTSSKAVHLSVAVAQHFSDTGNLIRLYSNPETFVMKLTEAGAGMDWPQKSAKGAK